MITFPTSMRTRREFFTDGLSIRFDERGNSGRPVLLLHGGAGPQTVMTIAAGLSKAHILIPTHPGFAGEPRPEWFNSVDDIAFTYLELLKRLNLHDVLVIGSSMGGWIASAMATRNPTRLSGLVLINAAGIVVDGHPIADVSSLTQNELMALSFHNPAPFLSDPATTVSPEEAEADAENDRALAAYTQDGMGDPKLRRRLSDVDIPVLVAWGASDRVIDAEYGRVYAQSFPEARFELIPEAGHLPQIEQAEHLLDLVRNFAISLRTTSNTESFEQR